MKTPSPLLFASTALTMALSMPAFAASPFAGTADISGKARLATMTGDDDGNLPLIRVGDDDDDDHRGRTRHWHDDDDDDDDDCDDGRCQGAGGRGNPAPAGTVAPPANGLFGNGAPPKAVTN
jgi:hypothetical protein